MLVVKYIEEWDIDHRQRWNTEVLQRLGERVVVRHRWNIDDFAFGLCERCTVCSASVNINENQRLRILDATGGTFTLSFMGQETAPIVWNQTPDGIRLALEELDDINPGDVHVDLDALEGYDIEFRGQWAYTSNTPLLVADTTLLSPGIASIEILQTTQGFGGKTVQSRITEVYKQSGNTWCPSCYGVGFEGGFEPLIYVTYAIITDQQADISRSKGGVISSARPDGQFAYAPILTEFDIVARVKSWEGDTVTPREIRGRYTLDEITPTTIHTGPQTTDDSLVFLPEDKRSRYVLPADEDVCIGQRARLSVMPYEHPMALVPLTYHEERLVDIAEEPDVRHYYEDVKKDVPIVPLIKGID